MNDILRPVMTFQQIGDALGISCERARQIYVGAIYKLQRVAGRRTVGSLLADIDCRREYAAPRGTPRNPEGF